MKNTISVFRGGLPCMAILMTLAASGSAAETDDDPSSMLQSTVEEVLTIAFSTGGPPSSEPVAERVRPILERTMDFESITRRAIGPGWRQFSSAERTRAVELFTTLVVRTYAGRFVGGERPKVVYKSPVATSPERWEVPTLVSRDGATYEIIYRIEKRADAWRVYDVIAEGMSFVANYRAQFDALFQRGGATAVLRALESRQAAATAR